MPRIAGLNKTEEVKKALSANPGMTSKEIADMLTAQGIKVSPNYVSTIKSKGKKKGKKKAKKAAPAAAPETAPAVPKDAVSLALLQKAKKLAAQFASISEAKAALAALSQLMD